MPDFNVHSTNHTSFTVEDLDRTVAFFQEALGFELLSKAPRNRDAIEHITGVPGADVMIPYLQGPGHRLELIEYLAPAERVAVNPRPCDTGFAHIAFDVDDIDAAIAASVKHDVVPINSPWVIDQGPNTGNRVVYLRARDGVTVEFIEKK